jgi:RNase H-like domain found in reverse transcriptase
MQTDASYFGLGDVLTQQFEDGEKVICYLSRSLSRQEMKLTVTEKECLAVIWSVEKLRWTTVQTHQVDTCLGRGIVPSKILSLSYFFFLFLFRFRHIVLIVRRSECHHEKFGTTADDLMLWFPR